MDPLGVERTPTTILAADIAGYSCLTSVDDGGMLFAINNAFDLMHAGESTRSVVVFD